jgi:hypothetical protein
MAIYNNGCALQASRTFKKKLCVVPPATLLFTGDGGPAIMLYGHGWGNGVSNSQQLVGRQDSSKKFLIVCCSRSRGTPTICTPKSSVTTCVSSSPNGLYQTEHRAQITSAEYQEHAAPAGCGCGGSWLRERRVTPAKAKGPGSRDGAGCRPVTGGMVPRGRVLSALPIRDWGEVALASTPRRFSFGHLASAPVKKPRHEAGFRFQMGA